MTRTPNFRPDPKERPTIRNSTSEYPTLDRPGVNLNEPELREIARRLAQEGADRLQREGPLPVRRREHIRKALRRLGPRLHWSLLASHRPDADEVAAAELRKLVKSGAKSMERTLSREIEHKETETDRIESVLEGARALSEGELTIYPREFTYERTVLKPGRKLVTVEETVVVENADDAQELAAKLMRGLPRAARLQRDMVARLSLRKEAFAALRRDTKATVRHWRGMLEEVLFVLKETA